MPTSVPTVPFTDERLSNGLRLIVAEDHLAPVVAVNVWYDVGSKHEQPGKTGFAHLFEHVMFQGSAHVGKAEHIALIQAAGGTMNGTTWLDRTNYFETLPAHQLELALWLEADRMGTLLDALSQENLDNQREVVKNEKRWSYDNRPYGSWQEKLQAHLYPEEHPYHHTTIGSMEDLDAASLEDVQCVLPDVVRAEQRGPVGGRRRRHRRTSARPPSGSSGHPGQPAIPDRCPTCRCRRRSVANVARPCSIACRCRGSTSGSGRRRSATPASTRSTSRARSWPAARAAGCTAGSSATSASPRTSRCSRSGFIGGASVCAGWATVRPGRRRSTASRRRSTRSSTGWPPNRSPTTSSPGRTRSSRPTSSGALQRVEERADRLSMYATLFDDPGLINRMLPRYLAVTAETIREVAAATFRPDNRLVLTYLPETAPADDAARARPTRPPSDEEVAA